MQYEIPRPYLLFLGEQTSAPHAKTAFGLRDWAPDLCVGEFALPGASGFHRIADTDAGPRLRTRRTQPCDRYRPNWRLDSNPLVGSADQRTGGRP